MIIGFDGSRAFLKERTGTENYSYQLLKALAKIDSKNQYVVYLRSHSVIASPEGAWQSQTESKIASSKTPRNDESGWPENFEFKVIKWPRLWTQVGLAKQTFQDKLDVLFIPAHTSPLIHKGGLKTVVTVHDLGAEYLPKMHQLKQRLYLKWITSYQLKNATKLISVSRATKDDLIKRVGIDPKKIEVVYEGYDEDLFKPVKGDILNRILRYCDIEKGKYFLFVGTLQPRKNLERLIKAFASVIASEAKQSLNDNEIASSPSTIAQDPRNDARKLVIVGSKGWLSDEIYKLPKKLGIEKRVIFLGHVKDQDLPALYSGAIALTFPSLFEGFGLPILEAQACGCPVITSNISSMPEVTGKGALLVNPESLDDIIRAIREIGEIREKIVKLGFENIKRFSWEKCARETLAVLNGVL